MIANDDGSYVCPPDVQIACVVKSVTIIVDIDVSILEVSMKNKRFNMDNVLVKCCRNEPIYSVYIGYL